MPDGMVYDLDGIEIGRARVVTRGEWGGRLFGALCFHDENVSLPSMTLVVEVPVPPQDPVADEGVQVRALTEEQTLTSLQPLRFRVVTGAPPLFLIETE